MPNLERPSGIQDGRDFIVTARTAVSKWQAMALRCLVEPMEYFPGHDLNLTLRFSMYHQTRLFIPVVPETHSHKLASFSRLQVPRTSDSIDKRKCFQTILGFSDRVY